MAKHLHRASKYVSMCNIEAVGLICKCGHRITIPNWSLTLDSDWCPDHWRLHGLRKAMDTYKRFDKHRKKRARLSNRYFARRAEKAGRSYEEQRQFEYEQSMTEYRKLTENPE